MQIPILSGVYVDGSPDFRVSYPCNMTPVPRGTGIANGYLRQSDGIVQSGTGPGVDRGGIVWNGTCYRVMGDWLCTVNENESITQLVQISAGGSGQVTLDYGFDRLAIAHDRILHYWDGTTLTQVTDADLGAVIDMLWVDGYYMTTDGDSLIVTELNNPLEVNPLKYGSSEADPDPILGLQKTRNEVYALNRHTIELFDNVGGENFPFQRIEGAQLQKGIFGTFNACIFMDKLAFLGGGRNEPPAVYIGGGGQTARISTREIDRQLLDLTTSELAAVVVESRETLGHAHLMIHLPTKTLVYDGAASQIVGEPIWFTLSTSITGDGIYRARNFVFAYGKWLCGDPLSGAYGYMTQTLGSHWGEMVGWWFGTSIAYNEGRGLVFHDLELVALTGHGTSSTIFTSYSTDGETWSNERSIRTGAPGSTAKRLVFFGQGISRNWRIQRFRGTSDAMLSIARIEVRVEALNV